MAQRYWIVICPEPYVKGGVWATWFREKCVAVGWPPSRYPMEGATDNQGWSFVRNRLREMTLGDKVVPFLLKWRIGPVGTVTAVKAGDDKWAPTVPQGAYGLDPSEPQLGRRIEVEWETGGMPPASKIALVPPEKRPKKALALHTVEEIGQDRLQELVRVLGDEQNWRDLGVVEPIPEPPIGEASTPADLSVLERDLQRFLTRNLGMLEPGLKPSPEYQLEEYPTDVGRIDLFCVDKEGMPVVVELKAGMAGDDVIGQIGGYMSWVKDNVAGEKMVRGIIVCRDVGPRVKAAARIIPNLKIKTYELSFRLQDVE